jgi:hypothetical protein
LLARDVLFSVFDEKMGALPIYYSGDLSKQDAQKVAFRSQMTLSMMSSADLETAEAILPFSSLNKIGFILLFQIHQTNPSQPKCVASLSYLVPSDQQVFLYNKVPFLKVKAEEIAELIKQNFIYSGKPDQSLPSNLSQKITSWRVTEQEATAEIQIVEKRVTLSEKKDGGSVEFFLGQIKKNEDRAIGALYRGQPVLVTGNSHLIVDLIVHSLDLFVPHASLRKVSYTTSIVDPYYADIIGISRNLVSNYPKMVLIDIDKKQVKNGETCLYSKLVVKQLRKKPDQTEEIIKDSTNRLLKVAGMLIDCFSQSEEDRETKLAEIQKNYNSALIEIAAEIAAQRNPLISEILLQQVSKRFLEFLNDI